MLNTDRRKTIAQINSVGTHCTCTVLYSQKRTVRQRIKLNNQHSANSTFEVVYKISRILVTMTESACSRPDVYINSWLGPLPFSSTQLSFKWLHTFWNGVKLKLYTVYRNILRHEIIENVYVYEINSAYFWIYIFWEGKALNYVYFNVLTGIVCVKCAYYTR